MSQIRQDAPLLEDELESPIRGFSSDFSAGERIPPHRHPFAQLIYATAGVMTVETDDGIWVVPPERAVWVPPFVAHSIAMTGSVMIRTLYLASDIAPIAGAHCSVVQVSGLLRASILRAVEFPQPYPKAGSEARIASVIIDEIREAPLLPLQLTMPRDARARRVAEALRRDPGDSRRLSDWGRIAGASERTLERLFQKEVSMSLGAWRQQARLLRALELLAAGVSVTSVALQLGFEGPSAFISMFRRAMGTTPGRYFGLGRKGGSN